MCHSQDNWTRAKDPDWSPEESRPATFCTCRELGLMNLSLEGFHGLVGETGKKTSRNPKK